MNINKIISKIQISVPEQPSFLILIGYALCYAPTLSYMNIRSSNTKWRLLKLSLPHIWLLLGVAIGATVTVNANVIYPGEHSWVHFIRTNDRIGQGISITSGLIFGGYIINELCNYFLTGYDYKKSLDPNFEKENNNQSILNIKNFTILHPANPETFPSQNAKYVPQVGRKWAYILFALLTKVMNVPLLYFPFVVLHYVVLPSLNNYNYTNRFFVLQWIGFVGACLGILYLAVFELRGGIVVSAVVKVSILGSIMIATNTNFPDNPVLNVFIYIAYLFFGFGYSYADLLCIETVSFKFMEIVLGVGFAIELTLFGVVHNSVLEDFEDWFCYITRCPHIDNVRKHCLPFLIIAAVVLVLIFLILPSLPKLSILEVRNVVYSKRYVIFDLLGVRQSQPSVNNNNNPIPQSFYQPGQHYPPAPPYQHYPQNMMPPNAQGVLNYPMQGQCYPPPPQVSQYTGPQYPGGQYPGPHTMTPGAPPGPYPPQMMGYNQNYQYNYAPQQPPAYDNINDISVDTPPPVLNTQTERPVSEPNPVENYMEKQMQLELKNSH